MDKENIKRFISKLSSKFLSFYDDENITPPEIKLADEVKSAHLEWIQSQKYFESVSDPELVDHAIFLEEAARRKYMYLLKKAREHGISLEKQ